jgi:hypothetical protein
MASVGYAHLSLVAILAFLFLVLTADARVGSHGGDLPAAATMTTRQFFGTLRFAPVPPSAPWNQYYSFGHQPPEDHVGRRAP